MSKWTPEPWTLEQNGPAWNLRSVDRVDQFMYLLGLTHNNPGEHNANAKRIVESVNACVGIEDPETTVPELVAALNECLQTIAHIVSKPIESQCLLDWGNLENAGYKARDVLAKTGKK